jgi:hypothetical protein
MADRPRILLVPSLTELEWLIKPQLEEWAEVASFDAPGVGAEPRPEKLDRNAIIRRAVAELERRGWDDCFIAGDSWGNATAVRGQAHGKEKSWVSRSDMPASLTAPTARGLR